jgi:hypothetical protein
VKSWIQTSVLPKKNKSQKHKHRPGSGVSLLILLATQEAEIGRIAIPTHPWANNSQKWEKCQVPVAHACNPSYSEDRDLENLGSKPAQANILSYNSSLSYIMIACSCGLWMALKISSMLCSLFLPVFLCHSLTMIVQQILFFLWYSMLFKKKLLQYWDLHSGPTPWATAPAFVCDGFFQYRISWTIFPGWLRTKILLISASSIARITGVNHWHLASLFFLI